MPDPGKKKPNPRNRSEDWLDKDEYPEDKDAEEFGDESLVNYDPLTIGRGGKLRAPFWTRRRTMVAVVLVVLVTVVAICEILPLLRR